MDGEPRGHRRRQALRRGRRCCATIGFTVQDGELVVAAVGPSGCGKIHAAAHRRRAGARRRGRRRARRQGRQRQPARAARRRDGVPELRAVSAPDRGRTTSRSALAPRGVPQRSATRRIARDRRHARARPLLERKPAQLSGGQRQRVALARALVRRPPALPARRAALEPRRGAARAHARRAQAAVQARSAPPCST